MTDLDRRTGAPDDRPPPPTPPRTPPRALRRTPRLTSAVPWWTALFAVLFARGSLWAAGVFPDRLRARLAEGRRRMREDPEAGYSTETVLVTALLVILALAVMGIISVKVIAKAHGIDLGGQ